MMKRILFCLIALSIFVSGQAFRLSKPFLNDSTVYEGLASNGVTQIEFQGDSLIWFATGGGLSKTEDLGNNFYSYYRGENNIPKGGISAIATMDSVIWIAAVFDSLTVEGELQTGGGLAYSKNAGKSWTYVSQPIDLVKHSDDDYILQSWNGDTITCLAITTPINNTTWDISVSEQNGDTVVYIVSWAGGLRRSKDFGKSWQIIPLPTDEMNTLLETDTIDFEINPHDPSLDASGNHNHKGFSVLSYGDTLWVGTADGVNLGIINPTNDERIRWRKYNAQNSTLSGNFIVALARQYYDGKETIWVGALTAEGSNEIRAVNKSSDGGLTWTRTLIGERVYGFAFYNEITYVCTENGLYKSIDSENWALYQPMEDTDNNRYIYSQDVYAAALDPHVYYPFLWIGTSDGIAKTADDGINWTIYQRHRSTSSPGEPEIYAFPNPFAPNFHNVSSGDGHVRIQYFLEKAALVKLDIYDFAMDPVHSEEYQQVDHLGDNALVWNGRNRAGQLVANGTYFCKLTIKDDTKEKFYWTKLIVIK
jgi:hypothetical protein